MAPQTSIPPAANILGGLVTSSLLFSDTFIDAKASQIIPQIWHNWRRKDTDGLPGLMVMLWASCVVPLGVYAIIQNFNLPLQLQPQCFGVLCLICWSQTLVYHNHWRIWTATLLTGVLTVVFCVLEFVLVWVLRGPYHRGVSWPVTMMGIIASVMLALGLIPPYFEMWKRNGRVVGISFVFLTVDIAGAFFSLMALVAQDTFDYLGGIGYIACMLLEVGIFSSHFIWLWRTHHIRKAAKKAGKTYDEYVAEKLSQAEKNQTQLQGRVISTPEKSRAGSVTEHANGPIAALPDLEKGPIKTATERTPENSSGLGYCFVKLKLGG
ncbi:hypothetical protein GQ43DRAFT_473367 [Delitschia confertaspora ATCC 74209]|uniref:PQ loop repeat protein n=1 Tax=Delitschia confertaspora ATCC 74209 TaxID=1513339 RepID=A0A9P4JHY0_9PLEO|nr:hypothetical protein GQ43DRAFT_473367 [Delitschia confertaspora ATCC 74209]